MSDEKIDYEWRIGTLKPGQGGVSQPAVMLNGIRLVSDVYREKVGNAEALLSEVTENAPFKCLEDKYTEFTKHLQTIANNSSNSKSDTNELKAIPGMLDDYLTAFRAFDDRTHSLISKRYGKESDQFKKFSTALSYEFDNVFAYKFAGQLRNYSQHAGSPISSYSVSTALVDGKPFSTVKLTINSNDMLTKYDKWRADVKAELQKINGDFAVQPLLKTLMMSCARAYNKYLLSQEEQITNAMGVIKEATKDIPDTEQPLFMGIPKDLKPNEPLRDVQLLYIKRNLVDSLEPMLQQAHIVTGQ